MKKVKVLIVDDSAVIRNFLTDILSSSPAIEVVATAMDPYFAIKKINEFRPDVITLDIDMPNMDGITFLSKLMISHPIPVVMVSTYTGEDSDKGIEALELGAIDIIKKPEFKDINDIDKINVFKQSVVDKVIVAAQSNVKRNLEINVPEIVKKIDEKKELSDKVVAIGGSTGAVKALDEIILGLSDDQLPIIIVQHMLDGFMQPLAERLNKISKFYVKIAEEGERLYKNNIILAPNNKHVLVKRDKQGLYVDVIDNEKVRGHRPSVDLLFESISQAVESEAVGILLTGMGDDGARGLLEMKRTGAVTIAQDKDSSAVYGMPKAAIEIGAAGKIMNIGQIVLYLNSLS